MIPFLADYHSDEESKPKESVVTIKKTESPFSKVKVTPTADNKDKPNNNNNDSVKPTKRKKKKKMALPGPKFEGAVEPIREQVTEIGDDEPAQKKQKISVNDLRPPQVRFAKKNISTEDTEIFSASHIKEKSVLSKRKKQ